jgi:uncharacterized protein YqjF (DUF2071 family)
MPGSRWTTVRATLTHVLQINYAVPAERVRPHVPPPLQLATVGNGLALVSAVVMREEGCRPIWLPKVGLRFEHVNFRTYVQRGGRLGAFLLHVAMSSPLAPVMRAVVGLPIRWTPLRFERARDRSGAIARQAVYSSDYAIAVEVQAQPYPLGRLAYFPSAQEGLDFLTGSPFAYFARRGGVYEYQIARRPTPVRRGRVEVARWEPLARLGILASEYESEHPHSVFLAQPTEITFYLPARRLDVKGPAEDEGSGIG